MPGRRVSYAAALTALAVALGPAVTGAQAASGPVYPKAGCFTIADPTGDATFEQLPNNPDLDVTGVALQTTKTDLLAFVKIAQLAKGPGSTDGARYTMDFTFNNHTFSASGSTYSNGSGAIRDGLASTGFAGHTTQLGVDVPQITVPPSQEFVTRANNRGYVASGLKVTFDTTNSWVVIDLPLADIQKYGGAKLAGVLGDVDVRTQTDEYAVGSVWDTAGPAAWTVGANTCFKKK